MSKDSNELYLEDKIALITGGGGGIGWGIGVEFARNGAKVVLVDIDEKNGAEVLADLGKISSGHRLYCLDVQDIEAGQQFVEEIWDQYGQIDILVCNAGINTPHGLLNMTPEAWDQVHDTNLRGHMFLSQTVGKKMIRGGIEGVILIITSVHQEVVQGRPHYSSSKAALAMLVKEMAVELAPHKIRVVGIAPGGIYINKRVTDPDQADDEPTVLLGGKNGIPRDIGRAAVFLTGNYWSRHITGEILTVSGGQYLLLKGKLR